MSLLLLLGAGSGFIAACTGLAGGSLLLAGLSLAFAPAVVVIHHAATQFAMNAMRVAAFYRWVRWRTVARFVPASLLGVAIAVPLLPHLPREVFVLLILLVIGRALWRNAPKHRPKHVALAAFLSGGLGVLGGSSGPLLSSVLLRLGLGGQEKIATKAAIQCAVQGLKIIAIGLVGAATVDGAILLPLIGGGAIGTLAGRKFVHRLDEASQMRAVKVVLGLSAVVLASTLV